ncbi:MAG TPA: choice-of-anchor tandem repeat GloVer-containing protein [Terriglobia bacterium]
MLAPAGCGVVFKLDPAGALAVLHTFTGAPDGTFPLGSLLIDASGNLYGTTTDGGSGTSCSSSFGCGTVFKLSPTGAETVLYSFTGGTDGAFPSGGLVRDTAGNLYGTTAGGGAHNFGTIFTLTTSGVETVLCSFTGERGGAGPEGGLLRNSAGTLYGTTFEGGAANNGVQAQALRATVSPLGQEG